MKSNCFAWRHLLHACLLPLRAALALADTAAALRPAPAKEAIPYGGQAAIEGVMMKGSTHAALAVRRRSGAIEVLQKPVKSRFGNAAKVPYARGFFILWDMMTLGMWAISESSRRYEADMLQADAEKAAAAGQDAGQLETAASEVQQEAAPARNDTVVREPVNASQLEATGATAAVTSEPASDVAQEQADAAPLPHTPAWVQTLMLVLSLFIAVIMFKIVPAVITTGIFHMLGWGPMKLIAHPTFTQQFLANLLEGMLKLGMFIGYIWAIGRIAEITRVFQYHGAEHIVINAYEHNPQNQSIPFIQSHSTAHPRCGTSFIVILILASIVLFTVLDWLLILAGPAINGALPEWWLAAKGLGPAIRDNIPAWWLRWPLRVIGLVPLSGISYEVIKAAFKYYGNPLLRPLLRFGMLFQALTTRRPSDEQVAVSLASFNRARFLSEGIPEPGAVVPATTAV